MASRRELRGIGVSRYNPYPVSDMFTSNTLSGVQSDRHRPVSNLWLARANRRIGRLHRDYTQQTTSNPVVPFSFYAYAIEERLRNTLLVMFGVSNADDAMYTAGTTGFISRLQALVRGFLTRARRRALVRRNERLYAPSGDAARALFSQYDVVQQGLR